MTQWKVYNILSYISNKILTSPKSKLNLDQKSSIEDRQAGSRLKLGLFSYPVLQAADILVHRYSLHSYTIVNLITYAYSLEQLMSPLATINLNISSLPVNAPQTSTTPTGTISSPPKPSSVSHPSML